MWSSNEKVWSLKWENETSNFWHCQLCIIFNLKYEITNAFLCRNIPLSLKMDHTSVPRPLFCGVQKSLKYGVKM